MTPELKERLTEALQKASRLLRSECQALFDTFAVNGEMPIEDEFDEAISERLDDLQYTAMDLEELRRTLNGEGA